MWRWLPHSSRPLQPDKSFRDVQPRVPKSFKFLHNGNGIVKEVDIVRDSSISSARKEGQNVDTFNSAGVWDFSYFGRWVRSNLDGRRDLEVKRGRLRWRRKRFNVLLCGFGRSQDWSLGVVKPWRDLSGPPWWPRPRVTPRLFPPVGAGTCRGGLETRPEVGLWHHGSGKED